MAVCAFPGLWCKPGALNYVAAAILVKRMHCFVAGCIFLEMLFVKGAGCVCVCV